MDAVNDGSESVDQFLARIASLKESRNEVSEDRTRRIEEDFQKSRKERQARRLERARSLSPSKTGPTLSSTGVSSPTPVRDIALNPPVDFSPRGATLSRSNAVRTSPTLEPKQQDPVSLPDTIPPLTAPPVSSALSRSGTLSWQQRPSGRGESPNRPRPLSTIATARPTSRDGLGSTERTTEPSRQDIAASLASKDSMWFKQTQDRAASSAAYRKTQIEDAPKVESHAKSQRLPGLAKGAAVESQVVATGISPSARNPSVVATSPSPSFASRHPTFSPSPAHSPTLPLSPEPLRPAIQDVQDQTAANATNRGFRALARSPSPTKGLGGFVQSAMMKRSDSVNKRWTVQATTGLRRGDSVAGTSPALRSKPAAVLNRDSNRLSPELANSRHNNPKQPVDQSPIQVQSSVKLHSRQGSEVENPRDASETTHTILPDRPSTPMDDNQLSRSPSKAVEARRWSPTKSSWLESTLLSQPEPSQIIPKVEEQPRWKVDLQRSRSMKEKTPMGAAKATGPEEELPGTVSTTAKCDAPTPSGTAKVIETQEVPKLSKGNFGVETGPPGSRSSVVIKPTATPTKALTASALAPETSNSSTKPPTVKPKPKTPPKMDFRANLKSRSQPTTDRDNTEPEFKAVFGKLRAAQTQSYVAPDILKTNILTGKAALAVTDGPQKSKRVDEFKDSIMQKKEAMKTMAEQKKQAPVPNESKAVETVMPEALARRKTLSKATPPVVKPQQASRNLQLTQVDGPRPVGAKPRAAPDALKPAGLVINKSPKSPAHANQRSGELAEQSAVEKHQALSAEKGLGITARTAASAKSVHSNESNQPQVTEAVSKDSSLAKSKPDPEPTLITRTTSPENTLPPDSKLGSRLNPNLAALLSRGPPAQSASNSESIKHNAASSTPQSNISKSPAEPAKPANGGELTHMTKGRAKGPKRRAPKAQNLTESSHPSSRAIGSSAPTLKNEASATMSPPSSRSTLTDNQEESFSKRDEKLSSPARSFAAKPVIDASASSTPTSSDNSTTLPLRVKPAIASKSPNLRKVSSSQPKLSEQQVEASQVESSARSTPLDVESIESAVTKSPAPVSPAPSATVTALQSTQQRSKPEPFVREKTLVSPITPTQRSKPITPSKPSVKAMSSPLRKSAGPIEQQKEVVSSTRSSASWDVAAVAKILAVYFPTKPVAADKDDFDTHALLTARRAEDPKSKTISHSITKIRQDGRKTPMPPQQEHVLYEDAMYLSLHTFETPSVGKQSEAILWCGDRVPDAAIEDVQIFCKRDARDFNTKLEVVKQGKEPATFLQALGGIVIIRRSESAAFYMLCGRQHLGHITFDELDLSAESLCSGYPYLISAKFGKLYLWKGKGSIADEIGCARLIGVDLGLTGEIEEVDEGAETSAFWEALDEISHKQTWSHEWQQRSEHNELPPMLYRVEQEQPKSTGGFWGLRASSSTQGSNTIVIETIEPFSHRDVTSGSVYLLDAYRSIYVMVSGDVSTKHSEFTTALHIAQEIAILSPSIQSRPSVPPCHVVFGEPPADVRAHFRKWSADQRGTAGGRPSACVRVEDVMSALEL